MYNWRSLSTQVISKDTKNDDLIKLLIKNRELDPLEPSFPKFELKNLDTLKKYIDTAILKQKNILIYGDYDVDGLTSTANLYLTLTRLGAKVFTFIPHREKHGYGFKHQYLLDFEKEKNIKIDLLITVDNGIVANKELEKISNCEIIIIDHHLKGETLPPHQVIIHSIDVCASALVYFVCQYLDQKADLSLAALATVADCLPLNGVNREIVFWGLKLFPNKCNEGLKKLLEISQIDRPLNSYDLAFVLAPRINAAGRLDDAAIALELLITRDQEKQLKLAQQLTEINILRQNAQLKSLETADDKANILDKLCFAQSPTYQPGIIGLIAGRLTDKYQLPSIAISVNDNICKGSCRSIKELNILDALKEAKDLLVDLGGHALAAGFSIENKNIEKFKQKISTIISQKLSDYKSIVEINIDAQMDLDAVTINRINSLSLLEPHGIGNPKPLFVFPRVEIVNLRILSDGKHLKLTLGENFMDAILFQKASCFCGLKEGQIIDLVASLDINSYQGRTSAQLIIKDIHYEES